MKPEIRTSLLVTSGNGPAECNQPVAGVLQHMLEEAESVGLDLDVSVSPSKHGAKSADIVVHGVGSDDFAKRWCGTTRWRAKSALRSNHKRANWFIGVFQLMLSSAEKV